MKVGVKKRNVLYPWIPFIISHPKQTWLHLNPFSPNLQAKLYKGTLKNTWNRML